jgi:hypothetical protein
MYKTTLNAAQYSIFAYIATYTADPSLALQAYFTTICALCYYDRIIMFDKAAASSQVSLVQATQPLGWTAFIIVAGMTVLHLLLVLLIIFFISPRWKSQSDWRRMGLCLTATWAYYR